MRSDDQAPETREPPGPHAQRRLRRGLLARIRIRKKLILLHTCFTAALALVLLLVLQPSVREIVEQAESQSCRLALDLVSEDPSLDHRAIVEGVRLEIGDAGDLRVPAPEAARLIETPGAEWITGGGEGVRIVRWSPRRASFVGASVRGEDVERAVGRLYVFVGLALLFAYGLIALALEVFVLPQHVYAPIRRLLDADAAVQAGARERELIREQDMPQDEMGAIMRSRNDSIVKIRDHEKAIAEALGHVEDIANDLRRKNHLLEMARRNMADQDRLASLGMMSAGLAHELNTPLAVLKGTVERLAEDPGAGVPHEQAQLMLRVVRRLERLSESLLDFARVRPPRRDSVDVREVVEEAWTLVRIDRGAGRVRFTDALEPGTCILGDADRLTQVFVNLLRNAADAMEGEGAITVSAEGATRDGDQWLSILCADDGPGIDPEVLPRLFEPFTSTRLDAHGAGLGLAVAEGIVREHGGVLLARNRPVGGAEFEVVLPAGPVADADAPRDDGAARPNAPAPDEPA